MTWTDAQGRPEILMNDSIICGTAAYRVVTEPGATQQPPRTPRTRKPSPVRAGAAAQRQESSVGETPERGSD